MTRKPPWPRRPLPLPPARAPAARAACSRRGLHAGSRAVCARRHVSGRLPYSARAERPTGRRQAGGRTGLGLRGGPPANWAGGPGEGGAGLAWAMACSFSPSSLVAQGERGIGAERAEGVSDCRKDSDSEYVGRRGRRGPGDVALQALQHLLLLVDLDGAPQTRGLVSQLRTSGE